VYRKRTLWRCQETFPFLEDKYSQSCHTITKARNVFDDDSLEMNKGEEMKGKR